MSPRIFSVFLFIVLLGCDQVVGPDYLGQPLFVIEGTVIVSDDSAKFEKDIDLALVWSGTGQEQVVARSFTTTRFPAVFEMALYEPPSARALSPMPGHDSAKFAVGQLIAFRDLDQDGIIEIGEPLVGEARDHVVTYFTEGGNSGVVTEKFSAGFGLKTLLRCSERENIWMVDAGSENVNLVFGEATSTTADFDCDDVPDDPCLQALLILDQMGQEGTTFDDAIREYETNGCYEQYGPVECVTGGCDVCENSPCEHPNPDCECPEEICQGDPACLCSFGEEYCDCPDGNCQELADGCEYSGNPGEYICNGCFVNDPNCACTSGDCNACAQGDCFEECPNGCMCPNGGCDCPDDCPQNNDPAQCQCSDECSDGDVCLQGVCQPFDDQMPCQTECECPEGWQCDPNQQLCCINC